MVQGRVKRKQAVNAGVRQKGLIKLVIGTVCEVLAGQFYLHLKAQGLQPNIFLMIAVATPGAFGLAGLLELVTGISFTDIAGRWDDLAGWQRGVLGVIVVVLAFVLMMVGVMLFA